MRFYSILIKKTGCLVVVSTSEHSFIRRGQYRYLFVGRNKGIYILRVLGDI